ncbi:uncharacterized protein LOC142985922 [Anticarsia gemmatalis]|uniref:uncharacterized protein LOC142985916 n=1 Tax=Anticarsia gemmatalis TaxID=129554 RepID=UPI003F76B6D4
MCENVTTRKKVEPSSSEIAQLTDQLRLMTTEFASVKLKLEDVTQSLSYTNERMDEMMVKLVAAEERLKYLEKRDGEVDTLQATVAQLQNELNTQAQANLKNEIEIVGIPESAAENLHHVVLVAAKKIGVEINDSDIDWVTRSGPRRPPVNTALPEDERKLPRPVVVRLLRRSKRDQFLKAAKSRKNISSADLEVSGTPRKIFFNERLTKANRLLFRDSRLRAKHHGYSFCWCQQGTIYIRQREGKGAIPIHSLKDLDRILPPSSSTTNSQ